MKMRFKRVYIEISNICNLECTFCPPLKRKKETMNLSQFQHIISQIKPYTAFVYFHIKGEPLIHPLLEQFLDVCEQNDIAVNLTTNGTLIPQKESILLYHKSVRQINISMHSLSDMALANHLINFSLKANDANKYISLRLWNLNKNNQTTAQSLEIMEKIRQAYNYPTSLADSMAERQSSKLSHHCFIGWEKEFVWPSLQNDFVSNNCYCYGMRHQIGILVDGTVVPCCLDAEGEAGLGNIFNMPFSDIISSPHAMEIKQGFENNLAVDLLCKHCSYR